MFFDTDVHAITVKLDHMCNKYMRVRKKKEVVKD